MARTLNIAATNRSGVQLTFQNAQARSGTIPAASAPTAADGSTLTVSTGNNAWIDDEMTGSFQLVSLNPAMTFKTLSRNMSKLSAQWQ